MGWFSQKNEGGKKVEDVPMLPELPKLPELPEIGPNTSIEPIPRLPSFPTSSIGEKFSQNTIKDAVTGSQKVNKEIDEPSGEKEERDAFESGGLEERGQIFQRHPRSSLTKEVPFSGTDSFASASVPQEFEEASRRVRKTEPLFIRIDKFEESLKIFEKTKEQVLEMEKMLREIRKIKEDEEKELEFWENEIQTIKEQIERVNKDIFSRIG